jgi:hypothetical protein
MEKYFQRRAQRRRKLLTPDPVDDMPIIRAFQDNGMRLVLLQKLSLS